MHRHRQTALILASMLSQWSCSALIGNRPDQADWVALDAGGPRPSTVCTRVGPLPYIEAVTALTGIVTGVVTLIRSGAEDHFGRHFGWSMLGGGTLWGASAGYGFSVNHQCGRFHDAWEAAGGAPEPPPWASFGPNVAP